MYIKCHQPCHLKHNFEITCCQIVPPLPVVNGQIMSTPSCGHHPLLWSTAILCHTFLRSTVKYCPLPPFLSTTAKLCKLLQEVNTENMPTLSCGQLSNYVTPSFGQESNYVIFFLQPTVKLCYSLAVVSNELHIFYHLLSRLAFHLAAKFYDSNFV